MARKKPITVENLGRRSHEKVVSIPFDSVGAAASFLRSYRGTPSYFKVTTEGYYYDKFKQKIVKVDEDDSDRTGDQATDQ